MIDRYQIRMARIALGWGVRDLAQKSDLSAGTVARIESGKEAMAGSLRKIEQAFVDAGIDFPDEDTVSIKRLRGKAQ
jgi:transcriptional regulator with XRE-family HTH domain